MSASVVSVRDELVLMGDCACGYQNLRRTYRAERVRFSEHSSVNVMSELHTTHLVLREFRDSDVDLLYEIQGNPDYMRFTFCAESRAARESWLRRFADAGRVNGFAPWTIVHRSDNRVIGWGGLSIDPNAPEWTTEVSYFIHPAYQGRGFATELVQSSLRHGFDDLGLREIAAFAMPENRASARVLEKCRFKFLRYESILQRNHYALRVEDW